MDALSPLPVLLCVLMAFLTSLLLARNYQPKPGKYATLDGLRGYLALMVFLHHATFWYFWLRTNEWTPPPSHLYTHLGHDCVALFFMITGFLFWTKLIESKEKPIQWGQLFISRMLRLMPLYFFMVLVMMLVVLDLSHFSLHEGPLAILKEIAGWLGFTMWDRPDVDGVEHTWMIISGVQWSLRYEWYFYLCLPLFGILFGRVAPFPFLLLGCGLSYLILDTELMIKPVFIHLCPFAGGMLAAHLVRIESFKKWAQCGVATVLALTCLAFEIYHFDTAYNAKALVFLSTTFILIACGNNLFGLLSHRLAYFLGERGYSLYLLHGFLLFFLFRFVLGYETAAKLSSTSHWLILVGFLTPALVLASDWTYRHIELPGMQLVPKWTSRLSTLTTRLRLR